MLCWNKVTYVGVCVSVYLKKLEDTVKSSPPMVISEW